MQYKERDGLWKIVGGYFFEKSAFNVNMDINDDDEFLVRKNGKIYDDEGYEIVSYRKN
jgi:hypothetical protein